MKYKIILNDNKLPDIELENDCCYTISELQDIILKLQDIIDEANAIYWKNIEIEYNDDDFDLDYDASG